MQPKMTSESPHGAMSQNPESANNIEASRGTSQFMRGGRQCCVRAVQHDIPKSKHALLYMSRTEGLQTTTKMCKADILPQKQLVIPLAGLN
jgi:hypothetical protein